MTQATLGSGLSPSNIETAALDVEGYHKATDYLYLSSRNLPNVAVIAVGGRGGGNLQGVSSENIVALCDVNELRAAPGFATYPKAARYKDYRKMLDEMHAQIDAVVIGTPDHTHV